MYICTSVIWKLLIAIMSCRAPCQRCSFFCCISLCPNLGSEIVARSLKNIADEQVKRLQNTVNISTEATCCANGLTHFM